jgi:hypothetical protein
MSLKQSGKSVRVAPAAGVDHVACGFADAGGFARHFGRNFWVCCHELGVEHHSEVHKTPDAARFFAESYL